MNPMQMLQNFIAKGLSPQKIVEQMAGDNPVIINLMRMANSGDKAGVEKFARNMYKDRGKDFDKEFADFMNQFR